MLTVKLADLVEVTTIEKNKCSVEGNEEIGAGVDGAQ